MSSTKRTTRSSTTSAATSPAKRTDTRPVSYTVIVRGQRFELSEDMIEMDSPNYFTSAFKGEWEEARERVIDLGPAHDPDLFALVRNYLCGYRVLPLSEHCCPQSMSLEAASLNLLQLAQFLALDALELQLQDLTGSKPMSLAPLVVAVDHPLSPLKGRDLLTERERGSPLDAFYI